MKGRIYFSVPFCSSGTHCGVVLKCLDLNNLLHVARSATGACHNAVEGRHKPIRDRHLEIIQKVSE